MEGVAGLQAGLFRPWLVRPAVPGIAALHFLPHVGPRTAPEAGQIASRLNGPSRRAGEFQQKRYVADHRVLCQTEHGLHAHLHTGRVVAGVIYRVVSTGGRDKLPRSNAVETLAIIP